jgi:hypothetical protein
MVEHKAANHEEKVDGEVAMSNRSPERAANSAEIDTAMKNEDRERCQSTKSGKRRKLASLPSISDSSPRSGSLS